jgi:hypothetical protein
MLISGIFEMYGSKVFIWLKHVPKRFTLPTSIPDMKYYQLFDAGRICYVEESRIFLRRAGNGVTFPGDRILDSQE